MNLNPKGISFEDIEQIELFVYQRLYAMFLGYFGVGHGGKPSSSLKKQSRRSLEQRLRLQLG